ncbi:HNH endonuclease [Marisediminicola antarctica]|uniref:HNH nuclease domain-containing protein n=1 Tax=Marisediminicola antarctica TaxID=674079 RepID=A0A7L5AMJ0_9MICO|nr:HNH endonuclease [Marisediminicola antarctica]QHO70341.1 hypothetical protein BHD05_12475 [Marisediminicola antarctica]
MPDSPPAATNWIVASNLNTFDSDAAFAVHPEIDWSETASAHIHVGDTVYLYGTAPVSALTHECRVVETGIPFDRVIDDREFWRKEGALLSRNTRSWMRLRLVHTFSPDERGLLSLARLRDNGLRSAPQGRVRVPGGTVNLIAAALRSSYLSDDLMAESADVDGAEVDKFREAIEHEQYGVSDRYATSKSRGSAQRAFAEAVKRNYGYRCAITGISTRAFLVASHIVPWAEDESIRLDPSNGICLSTLVDRAFDTGFLSISGHLRVVVDRERVARDPALEAVLVPLDGKLLEAPSAAPPRPEHLARRRAGGIRFN